MHRKRAVRGSGAVVVAAPAAGYTDEFPAGSPEATAISSDATKSYARFRADLKNRRRIVYVGANDGMLHAFDAGTGVSSFDVDGNRRRTVGLRAARGCADPERADQSEL